MSWSNGRMVAFDTETTGVDRAKDRIVTASIVDIQPGQAPAITSWLVNPGVEIPEAAAEIHGVTTEIAREKGRDPVECIGEITAQLGKTVADGVPLVICNAPFDLTLLAAECRRYNLPTLADMADDASVPVIVIDPLVLDRAVDKYRRGKRTLTAMAEHYRIDLPESEAHTSTGDCLAAARVAWRIARQYPAVGAFTLPDLMEYQRAAHVAWAENFEAYLTRSGRPESISREWPGGAS